MTADLLEIPIGRFAAGRPAAVAVFEKHGIDYCCGGRATLRAACGEKALDPAVLLAEIADREALGAPADAPPDDTSISSLIVHIVGRYHAKLREDLPRLAGMTAGVKAHEERHPELVAALARAFGRLRDALEPHLVLEEDVRLEILALAGRAVAPDDAAAQVVGELAIEHEEVGALLAGLRRATDDYTPIPDACATWRGLLSGLAELEEEIHRHVHLENNVLLPAALRLISGATAMAPAG